MASTSPSAAIGRTETFSAPESRAEQGKSLEKQAGHALSEATTSAIGDKSANNRWLEMTMSRTTLRGQAQSMLNDGFMLTDDKAMLADKSNESNVSKQIKPGDGNGERGKEQTEAEKKQDAELHHTVDAIRNSGMLNAPGRTGKDDTEYKMAIFKDGTSTKIYKNVLIGKDPKTHSDAYAQDAELTAIIAGHFFVHNEPTQLIHSHPNKPGMDPNVFSKEDIVESNASGADGLIVTPDGRVFRHISNPDPRLQDTQNITDEMRKPDECLGKFDEKGKFHKAIYGANKTVTFDPKGF